MFAFCFARKSKGRFRCGVLVAFCGLFICLHLPAAQLACASFFVAVANDVPQHQYQGGKQYQYRGGKWQTYQGEILDAQTLLNHLNNTGGNALRELGRLILAQHCGRHNTNNNLGVNYFVQHANDFRDTAAVKDLAEHIFYSGHLGRYDVAVPNRLVNHSKVEKDEPCGMFNLQQTLQDRHNIPLAHRPLYRPRAQLPVRNAIDVNLDPIYDMLASFFSQPVGEVLQPVGPWSVLRPCSVARLPLCVKDLQKKYRIDINFTIAPTEIITNLVPGQPCGICRERQLPGGAYLPGALTNEFLLVLEVTGGKIKLITLYPLG